MSDPRDESEHHYDEPLRTVEKGDVTWCVVKRRTLVEENGPERKPDFTGKLVPGGYLLVAEPDRSITASDIPTSKDLRVFASELDIPGFVVGEPRRLGKRVEVPLSEVVSDPDSLVGVDRVRAFLRGDIQIDREHWERLEAACGFPLDAEDRELLHDALHQAALRFATDKAFGPRGADLENLRRLCDASGKLLDALRALPEDTRRLLAWSLTVCFPDDRRSPEATAYRKSGLRDPEPLLGLLRARAKYFLEGAEMRRDRRRPDGGTKKKSGRPANRWLEPLAKAAVTVWRRRGGKGPGVYWDSANQRHAGSALALVREAADIIGLSHSDGTIVKYMRQAAKNSTT